MSGSFFYDMEQELRRFLDAVRPEFDISYRMTADQYGYMWLVLEGRRMEDLLAGITAAGDTVAEKGFEEQLLAAVFQFKNERASSGSGSSGSNAQPPQQYLVYNYKRNNFYPFIPLGAESGANKKRDYEGEMRMMSAIINEVPFEKDMALWYPLWDLPLK